jgi:hypothetical protein
VKLNRMTALALAVLAACGCGGGRAKADGTAIPRQCQPPGETTRALVLAWDPARRAALEGGSGGVAVVRYDGCSLELLDDCLLDGKYVAEDVPRASSAFSVRDEAALDDKLALGADDMSAELAVGRLAVEYVTAGVETSLLESQSRGMLRGRCDRATHFVREKVRGAYEITVDDAASGGGKARVVRNGGDLYRCRDGGTRATDPACRAVIQVALTPISELTSDRGDLYAELGKDVATISDMEEALRALQNLAAGATAPGASAGGVDANASGVSKGILAIPDGGSDAWDAAVTPILVGAFDRNGSSRLDTAEEIAAIPCEVLAAMDASIKRGRGGMTALRTTYGFAKDYLWVGYALGFDEKVRPDADARLANCGL